ncbi:hypothetical protein V8E54_013876 [Elaphomyces granulatus]
MHDAANSGNPSCIPLREKTIYKMGDFTTLSSVETIPGQAAESEMQPSRRSQGRPRKQKYPEEETLAGLEQQPPRRPRGRPRKYPEEETPEVQPRPRGRPRKYPEEETPEVQPRPRGRPRKYPEEETPEVQPRPRGRPRRTPSTPTPSADETPGQPELEQRKRRKTLMERETTSGLRQQEATGERQEHCMSESEIPINQTQLNDDPDSTPTPFRQGLPLAPVQQLSNKPAKPRWSKVADARVQFEDDRWLRKQRDSDFRAWCKPVARELQLDTVQSFYKAMHDETTLETKYSVVCGLQKASKDLEERYMWEEFHGLYVQVESLLHPSEQDHFQCRQCFPRNNANIPVCHDCEGALQRRRLPRACQVNMLQLKCQHRHPKELTDLSPLEERLIGLYQPCGWITKFQIELDKGTSGRYRKGM